MFRLPVYHYAYPSLLYSQVGQTPIRSDNEGGWSTIPHPPVCCCQHNTCQSDSQQKADLVLSAASIPSREEVLKDLDNLASEVEEDVLEQLAKFGRLLQLETAHSGRDNNEMVGLLDSLHAVIEGEHEARRDKEEVSQTPNGSDKQADLVVDTRPGVDENTEEGVVDEEEEESSPILPAFTSTSINTNCVESKATFEALRNKSSSPIQPSRLESDVPSCPQEETDDQARAREDTKSGKKQVSFVTEEGVKHHGSNITFYADMSVNDLAELVSSALVSDLAPYASDSGSDPSVIAVKYVSVMTTEKNKTILRPVFAKKHGSKQNTLAFTITGEILLSSQTSNDEGSPTQHGTIDLGTDQRMACPTVPPETVDRGGDKESTFKENKGSEGTDISETRAYESQASANVDNSVEDTSEVLLDTETLLDAGTTSLEYVEQSYGSQVEAEVKTPNAGERDSAIEKESGCQPKIETAAAQTETVEEQSNEDSSAQIERDTDHDRAEEERAEKKTNGNGDTTYSEAEKQKNEGDLAAHESVPIESNRLRIEVDVAAMCSAMCRAIPQVLNQLAIETATRSLTLDRATFMQTEVTQCEQQKSSSQEMENAHPGQGQGHEGSATHLEAATPSSDSTPEEKKEQAPAPYVYRLFTPNSFNTTPELMKEMTTSRQDCNSAECKVVSCGSGMKGSDSRALVPFDSQIITLKAFERHAEVSGRGGDTETKSDVANTTEARSAENTVNALVPFDSQIITIKAFKTAPLATPSTGAAVERQDETAITELNTDKASVSLHSQAGTDTSTTHDDREMAEEEKALVPFNSQIVTLKVLKTTTKEPVPNDNTAPQDVKVACVAEPNIESDQVITFMDDGGDNYGTLPEIEDLTPSIMATQECKAGSGVPTDIGAHKEVTSSRSDKEATGSRTHKSLPSFRRADLEQAANPQDGRTGNEKFKLRRTKSRPAIPLMEPLPMLLPRRPKLNPKLYQTPEDVSNHHTPTPLPFIFVPFPPSPITADGW